MEDTEQHEDRPGTGQMKNKSYDEILVHLGIKKEEVRTVKPVLCGHSKRPKNGCQDRLSLNHGRSKVFYNAPREHSTYPTFMEVWIL